MQLEYNSVSNLVGRPSTPSNRLPLPAARLGLPSTSLAGRCLKTSLHPSAQAPRSTSTTALDPRCLKTRVIMEDDQSLKSDKLVLRGLKFHGFHGVKPEERKLGQKFVIDVDTWLDLKAAGISDDLSDTVSYTDIYRIVKDVVEGEPQNLLESVAHKIVQSTLTKFAQISAVRVKVGKPHVAVLGQVDYLGVEILRTRKIDS